MLHKLNGLLIVLLTFFISDLHAQDSLARKKVKILPVPTFGYEPETRTKVGAVSLFTLDLYQDGITRTSNAKLEFNYTWRKQVIAEAEWNYFFQEEAWFSKGRVHISKYPDFYYGIDSETVEESELLFESNRSIIELGQFRNMGKKLFLGAGIRYLNYRNVGSTSAPNPFAELTDAHTFGLLAAIFKDSRNNLLNSTSGKYSYLELAQNFGTESYLQIKTDYRRYFSWRSNTIALRLYNVSTFGTAPFYDHAIMGGDDFVRGYFFGRFRDQNLSTFQAEYRTSLFWKLGIAAFGGLSTVYPDLDRLTDRIRPNMGAGIRFLVDKEGNTNLRLDFAFGSDDQSGFYVSFGESF